MTASSESDPSSPKKRQPRKKSAGPVTDLQAFISSKNLRFESPEEPEERRSRLSIEQDRARHELWRDKAMLYACLVAMTVLGLVSIAFLFMPGHSSDTRTWAASTLSAIVSGVVNYSLGRAGKAP